MRKIMLAGAAAAAFALSATPSVISAQTAAAPDASTNTVADKREMSAQERAEYDSWPPETRAMYDALEPEYQIYYWTLTPEQREAYGYLTDEQRAQLAGLTPEQQAQAWASITAQVRSMQSGAAAGQGTTGTTGTSGTGAGSTMPPRTAQVTPSPRTGMANSPTGNIQFTRNEVVQQTPNAQRPSEYPVCTAQRQDSCINPRAARRR